MKLSNAIKEAIIMRIMQDVPYVDYEIQAEALLRKTLEAKLPPDIKRIAKGDNSFRLKYESFWFDGGQGGVDLRITVPGITQSEDALTDEEEEPIRELCRKAAQLRRDRQALNRKLEISFASVTTRKQFVTAFPEFAQYAPEEPEQLANMVVGRAMDMADVIANGSA